MKLGMVEDFMFERLEPKRGTQLSGGDLFLAYQSWCDGKTMVAFNRKEFGRQFNDLAIVAGIGFTGSNGHGVYRDVVITWGSK